MEPASIVIFAIAIAIAVAIAFDVARRRDHR
jgi:hypothetical protein